ncbi:MAG: hypothetical protein ACRD50_12030 [Candidatus Acidiferrales bacterium]
MIPLVAYLRIRRQARCGFGIWAPLVLVWLLLLPIFLLLLPLFFIGCAACQVSSFRALSAFWGILTGLHNTHTEVEDRSISVLVDIF